MARRTKLIDQIFAMEPEAVLIFRDEPPTLETVRTTVSRLRSQEPAREYAVKKGRDGVAVVRLA